MPKLKNSPPSSTDQSARFIEAARAAGASEDEAVFDANLKKIVKAKAVDSVTSGVDTAKYKKR